MTQTIPLSEVPKNIGRNDPCPCGSKKKYKKCCLKVHKLEQEATKTTRSAEELIDENTSPWAFFKLLSDASSQNLLNFLYDLTAVGGDFQKKYPSAESLFKAISSGEMRPFASNDFEVVRMRHDGEDTLLMLARGLNSKQATQVIFEIYRLRNTGKGLRIWDIEFITKDKQELTKYPRFSELGIKWSWEK